MQKHKFSLILFPSDTILALELSESIIRIYNHIHFYSTMGLLRPA